jgi:FkbM family methyltransferase
MNLFSTMSNCFRRILANLRDNARRCLLVYPRGFDMAKRISRYFVPPSLVYRRLLEFARRHSANGGDFVFFIQVGSNDGLTNDPLREFVVAQSRWRGAFVEPLPHLFDALRRNYAYLRRPGLVFLRGAVSGNATTTSTTIFRIRPDRLSSYTTMADQLASWDPQHIIKHYAARPRIAEDIEAVEVPCFSIQQIMLEANIPELHLLHVDIEGGEASLFRRFPFDAIRPLMIIYESMHLSAEDRAELESHLRREGYWLESDSFDTVAAL